MDLQAIRDALIERRGQWSRIASSAGLSRKTVERFIADPSYNPTIKTMQAIQRALVVHGDVERSSLATNEDSQRVS